MRPDTAIKRAFARMPAANVRAKVFSEGGGIYVLRLTAFGRMRSLVAVASYNRKYSRERRKEIILALLARLHWQWCYDNRRTSRP